MSREFPNGIDVVVVTYNSAAYLPRLAESIQDFSEASSVTIVDNNSRDDSASLAERLDWGCEVSIVRRGSNPGFGASMNLGALTHGRHHDQILILNPDVALSSSVLTALSSTLKEDGTLGAIGPVLRTSDGNAVSSARNFPTVPSIARRYVEEAVHNGSFTLVDWICGAAMLWKREAFEELEGFSEDFFLYFEDVDICRRASDAGWRIAIDGSSTAIHDQGHGRETSAFLRNESRISRKQYARKWLGARGVIAAYFADACDLAADTYHGRRGK